LPLHRRCQVIGIKNPIYACRQIISCAAKLQPGRAVPRELHAESIFNARVCQRPPAMATTLLNPTGH
jgi:hypothetical protein